MLIRPWTLDRILNLRNLIIQLLSFSYPYPSETGVTNDQREWGTLRDGKERRPSETLETDMKNERELEAVRRGSYRVPSVTCKLSPWLVLVSVSLTPLRSCFPRFTGVSPRSLQSLPAPPGSEGDGKSDVHRLSLGPRAQSMNVRLRFSSVMSPLLSQPVGYSRSLRASPTAVTVRSRREEWNGMLTTRAGLTGRKPLA